MTTESRRPIETRNTSWAQSTARELKRFGFTPNSISLLSIAFAAMAGISFYYTSIAPFSTWMYYSLAAFFIQMRLLCNLFDGMIAMELGLKSKSGEIFNDAPDRPSDIFILLGAGACIQSVNYGWHLGWAAALLAVLTAYVRVLGVSVGAKTYFSGPMAKQHRMALITIAALATAIERYEIGSDWALTIALVLVIIGSAITCARRLFFIIRDLESK